MSSPSSAQTPASPGFDVERSHPLRSPALRRTVHTLVPLLIAAVFFVGPHLPREGGLAGVRRVLVWPLARLSIAQEWGMYAPNAPRSHGYTRAWAIGEDGLERALEENAIEAEGWGTTWGLNRARFDVWRHHVGHIDVDEPTAARKWYAVALCVRESRRGEVPRRIRLESVRRRFNAPDAVAAGKAVLAPAKVSTVLELSCRGPQPMRYVDIDRRTNPSLTAVQLSPKRESRGDLAGPDSSGQEPS